MLKQKKSPVCRRASSDPARLAKGNVQDRLNLYESILAGSELIAKDFAMIFSVFFHHTRNEKVDSAPQYSVGCFLDNITYIISPCNLDICFARKHLPFRGVFHVR
jgi:hypothetical protein